MDGRMRLFVACAALLLTHSVGVSWQGSSVFAATALKKPIHTNKSRFRIPFNSDVNALKRMNTVEIQLHFSRDSGTTWELAQTLAPESGKFEFQAPSEGEYWFSVKTLDGQNQLHPPVGKYETGLIVVVDLTKPTLDLSLKQLPSGKVQLNWQATDRNIDTSSLKIEYIVFGSQTWEAVPQTVQLTGETQLRVSAAGPVSVQGTISDYAGNVTQTTAKLRVEQVDDQNTRPRAPAYTPVAETPPVHEKLTSVTNESSTLDQPGKTSEREYQGPIIVPQGGLARLSHANSVTPSVKNQLVSSASQPPSPGRWNGGPTEDSLKPLSNDVVSTPAIPTQSTPLQAKLASNPARAGSQPSLQRMVAQRKFQLGYAIDNVGPSGIAAVELFITEDKGQTWFKYGDDPDQKSPIDVELQHDGVYGFSIRSRSGVGLSNDLPMRGEAPEIVVVVDQTAPVVELLPIEQGRGPNANQLRIRWKIVEEFPAEKPVALQYATNFSGPWVDISTWREDPQNGFIWTVGPGIPGQIYLRVLVRDALGNVGTAETPSPVLIDLQRPMARIVEVGVDPSSGPK